MEVMKQLDQGEIAATARARLHGDMVPPRVDVQVSRPQAPRPMPPAMNQAFTYPGKVIKAPGIHSGQTQRACTV